MKINSALREIVIDDINDIYQSPRAASGINDDYIEPNIITYNGCHSGNKYKK